VIGEQLPPLEIPLTRTVITGGAIATRDYLEIHHDTEAARERGLPDIITNILTTQNWVGRFVTDWAGPAARLRRVAVRLGAPNHPGDTLRFTGEVVDVAGSAVTVAVVATNSLGDHATATVVVDLGDVSG
jgi:acyl dehydratase